MKSKLRLLPLFVIYLLLISASHVVIKDTVTVNNQNIMVSGHHKLNSFKEGKRNFLQRLALKIFYSKKIRKATNADKLASASLWLGIGACFLLLLSLFVPYALLVSTPAGIAAMITGKSALNHKTSLVKKVRIGKRLGKVVLILFCILLLIVVLIIATSGSAKNAL
jgi:4-amino-4-deoxy-L-arabinose transferase-like glycosyltransferase